MTLPVRLFRVCLVVVLAIYVLVSILAPSTAFAALSPNQIKALRSGPRYFNTEAGVDGCGGSPIDLTIGGNTTDETIWQSGLQPPYYLEAFAIETLKDLAGKTGVSTSTTVTQEHVVALVAWFWREGGDINSSHLFNPLNSGINDPALVAGQHAGDGTQSFKSFDAGVEATTRSFIAHNQSRVGSILSTPGSTAEQVMAAIAGYQNYTGNKAWAWGTFGNDPADVLRWNQTVYLPSLLQILQQVRANYAEHAATMLGTPDREQFVPADNVPASQLKFGGGTASAGSGSSDCGGNVTADVSGIVALALKYSWPEAFKDAHPPEPGRAGPLTPNAAYAAALAQYNHAAPFGGADCGSLVGTVMRASGADPEYPLYGTATQKPYLLAHPEKYEIIPQVSSTSQLQPGDILIVTGSPGHTFIYVGPQPNGLDAASASGGDRMPNLTAAYFHDYRGYYMVARLKS